MKKFTFLLACASIATYGFADKPVQSDLKHQEMTPAQIRLERMKTHSQAEQQLLQDQQKRAELESRGQKEKQQIDAQRIKLCGTQERQGIVVDEATFKAKIEEDKRMSEAMRVDAENRARISNDKLIFSPLRAPEAQSLQDSILVHDSNGVLIRSTVFTYNDENQCVEQLTYDYEDGITPTFNSKYTIDYSENNSTIQHYFEWDPETQSWIVKNMSINEYDEYGWNTYEEDWYFDYSLNMMTPSYKRIKVYDDHHNIILDESYNGNSSTLDWTGNYKNEYAYEYDEQGNKTYQMSLTSYWDYSTNDWYLSWKTENKYDARGNSIYNKEMSWDRYSNAFVGSNFAELAYNDNGLRTMYKNYNWNYDVQDWYLSNIYCYDDNGNLISQEGYSWNSNTNQAEPVWKVTFVNNYNYNNQTNYYWNAETQDWAVASTEESTYDNNGRQTSYKYMYWDNDLQMLWGSNYWTSSYNDYGNETSKEYYSFSANDGWFLIDTYDYAFDMYGNQTLNAHLYYNWDTHEIEGGNKYEYGYNENHNLLLFARSDWDSEANDFIERNKTEYVYENGLLIKDTYCTDWDYSLPGFEYVQETIYSYDEQGRKLQETITYSYPNYGSEPYTETNDFNYTNAEKDGFTVITCEVLRDNVVPQYKTIEYYKGGNLVKEEYYDYTHSWNEELEKEESEYILTSVADYDYDANGNKIYSCQSNYDQWWGEWWYGTKYYWAYNDNGQLLLESYENYNEDLKEYVVGYKKIYDYDENGNQTLNQSQYFDYNGVPTEGNKKEYAYNDNGLQLMYASYYLETSMEPAGWVGNNKWMREYNNNGALTAYVTFYWNSNTNNWQYNQRSEYIYDYYGNLVSQPTLWWSSYDNVWQGWRSNDIYDQNGNWMGYESYNYVIDHWVGSYKTTYNWDEDGTYTYTNYAWDNKYNDWYATYQSITYYNVDGNTDTKENYLWNDETNQLELSTIETYFYSMHGVTGITDITLGNGEDSIYRLDGVKVNSTTTPGIYIVNGKKTLVK